MSATHVSEAWSCSVRLVVEDDRYLKAAVTDLATLLGRVDAAASRFRAESALSQANARPGRPCAVPKLLADLIAAALDAAERTDGAVDPTLGLAMQRIGYDRDIAAVRSARRSHPAEALDAAAAHPGGWRAVTLHREAGLLTVPVGVELDLGATAKAWTADRAARTLSARFGTGVMVEIGGDVAVSGPREGGWVIRVAERAGGPGQLVRIRRGGITTSTTTVRTWQRDGRTMHHIVDPATGEPVDGPWRTVTVATHSALAANTASTAAVVKGFGALQWLSDQGLAARLVRQDGEVFTTSGWPPESPLDLDQVFRSAGSATRAAPPSVTASSRSAAPGNLVGSRHRATAVHLGPERRVTVGGRS